MRGLRTGLGELFEVEPVADETALVAAFEAAALSPGRSRSVRAVDPVGRRDPAAPGGRPSSRGCRPAARRSGGSTSPSSRSPSSGSPGSMPRAIAAGGRIAYTKSAAEAIALGRPGRGRGRRRLPARADTGRRDRRRGHRRRRHAPEVDLLLSQAGDRPGHQPARVVSAGRSGGRPLARPDSRCSMPEVTRTLSGFERRGGFPLRLSARPAPVADRPTGPQGRDRAGRARAVHRVVAARAPLAPPSRSCSSTASSPGRGSGSATSATSPGAAGRATRSTCATTSGRQTADPATLSFDTYTEDVVAAIERFGPGVVVVGHGMGGLLALKAAERHADRRARPALRRAAARAASAGPAARAARDPRGRTARSSSAGRRCPRSSSASSAT